MENENSIYNKNNLNKWFLIRALYFRTYRNYTMKMHSHGRIELMYVNFGEMVLEYMDGDTPKQMFMLAGEYVFLDAFFPHRITVYDKDTQIFCIELSLVSPSESNQNSIPMTLANFLENEPSFKYFYTAKNPMFKLYDDGPLLKYLLSIQNYLKNNETQCPTNSFINLNLGLVLLSVCRTQQAQYSSKTGISYLKKALAFINENYSTDITSKSIAEAAGVSQSYLNKLFRNDFNLSINEYLNKLRVERAKKLMEQTNLSLGEIYPIIGIRTKQNFNKHFFRYNKVSPQEYKKSTKSETRLAYIDGHDNIRLPDYVYNFILDSSLTLDE